MDAPAPASDPPLLRRLPLWTAPAILVAVPLLVGVLVALDGAAGEPVGLYDEFVWKYYWGPIKADATNVQTLEHDGVEAHSGYNVVNTLSWALLLGICILGASQMLLHYAQPMDTKLILGATAWVVAGSVAHVLEDAALFATPLQYFFITPPIYLLFAAFGILSFLFAQLLRRLHARSDIHVAVRMLWLVHVLGVLLWTAFWLKGWGQIEHYVHPLWVTGFALASFFLIRWRILKAGQVDAAEFVLTNALGAFLLILAYAIWFARDPWVAPDDSAMPAVLFWAPALAAAAAVLVAVTPRKALLGFVVVMGSLLAGFVVAILLDRIVGGTVVGRYGEDARPLAILAVALVVGAGVAIRSWNNLRPRLGEVVRDMGVAFLLPVNLLIVFSQMLDAFATSIGIDLAGYDEKHVLSAGVIDVTRDLSAQAGWDFGATYPTFIGFATVKLVVSLLVVLVIDVFSKEDATTNPTMIGLVKFSIIMVGIGPGVRDFVRLALGV